jgi:hypothetical protein
VNAVSPAHLIRHDDVLAQLNEQSPRHVTSHVDPSLQVMLPLAPSVTAQVAFSPQSMLHESPQVPRHVASVPQASVQLWPHSCGEKPQGSLATHAQLVPVQTGGGSPETPPQPDAAASRRMTVQRARSDCRADDLFRIMILRYRDLPEAGWTVRPGSLRS